jgi:hypothetical protein
MSPRLPLLSAVQSIIDWDFFFIEYDRERENFFDSMQFRHCCNVVSLWSGEHLFYHMVLRKSLCLALVMCIVDVIMSPQVSYSSRANSKTREMKLIQKKEEQGGDE